MSNCEADQHLCFRYTDSTILLLSKFNIPTRKPSSVLVQLNLCQSWTKTPKISFLASWLKCTHYDTMTSLTKKILFQRDLPPIVNPVV